ncbi:bifunctional UDP-3-O-[3-hydroxymyristoyl] N-acetylglucosamine deacetylase/3-hydroxyacyl-ACP dehydratase [bacterium]|nr:MAG: bifunctional UDP-3-O-[3-hydroxymyristoyl] N-acetylglucosamine deacetylase/3-hydroxyacyl-ACP dehydratase [bacterium]
MEKQKTIANEISMTGTGLHTAGKARIVIKPAPVDSGINFVRTDLPGKPVIKASIEHLLPESFSQRRTSIGDGDTKIHTIEHLMAALAGSGIDNAFIEIDSDEIPGMDGSSLNFLKLLDKAGVQEQEKSRKYFQIREPVFVEESGSSVIALPSSKYRISYLLDYNRPFMKAQFFEIDFNSENFKSELARARTFCLEEEAVELQNQGLGKGANYDNTLVVSKSGIVKNRLRYEDEFIRHKILDLVGDIFLLGYQIKGHIIALKSGHALNLKLAKKIALQNKKFTAAGITVNYQPREGEELDVNAIMKILPHREPFLFVDKITSLEKGKHVTGVKNITINDYFFKGHFPGNPVMPGVLIIEAMAQVGGVMMLSPEENRGKIAYFLTADNVKFRKTVLPGDQLILDVTAGKIKSKTCQVYGKALVNGKVVAEADLMFALADS